MIALMAPSRSKYGAFDVSHTENGASDEFEVTAPSFSRVRVSAAALMLVFFAGMVAFRAGTSLHPPRQTMNG